MGDKMKPGALFALALALCALVGCASPERGLQLFPSNPDYRDALSTTLPTAELSPDRFWDLVAYGHVVEAWGYQAKAARSLYTDLHWRPDYLSTLVIAVATDEVTSPLRGWKDLLAATEPVTISRPSLSEPLLWSGIGSGTDDPLESTTRFLYELSRSGRLNTQGRAAPIHVCFDHEVNQLHDGTRRYDIVVPIEGTVSELRGLLSRNPFDAEISPQALLAAGFRLPDGKTLSPADYSPSVRAWDEPPGWSDRVTSQLRRHALGTRVTLADHREQGVAAFAVLLFTSGWAAIALLRVSRGRARRAILATGILLLGWILLRALRYPLDSDQVSRLMWYLFYLPMLALPLVLLWTAQTMSFRRRIGWGLLTVYNTLVLGLVLTNDLHQQVFSFEGASGYQYRWGYAAAAVGMIVPTLWSFQILIAKSHALQSRRTAAWPSFWVAVMALFCLAYGTDLPVLGTLDFTLTFSLLAIAFYESALRTGFLPNNRKHHRLFRSSPLGMQILDQQGHRVLASATARPLDEAEVANVMRHRNTAATTDPNTIISSAEIPGGRFVWQQDLSGVRDLQHRLRETSQALRTANETLSDKQRFEEWRARISTRAAMFDDLDQVIASPLAAAARLASEEPLGRPALGGISLLLCQAKRRANLYFSLYERRAMTSAEFIGYLNELLQISSYTGVRGLISGDAEGFIPLECASSLYDDFTGFLLWGTTQPSLTAMVSFRSDGETFALRVVHSPTPAPYPGRISLREEAVHGEVLAFIASRRADYG